MGHLFGGTEENQENLGEKHVSHPYRTTGKITVLYILMFKFFDSNREDRRFWAEWQQALPQFNLLFESNLDLLLSSSNI
jgi:hypothetical protein